MKIPKLKHMLRGVRIGFWFSTGAALSLFFILSSSFLIFQKVNNNTVYPGVFVGSKNLGGMSKQTVRDYFLKKNEALNTTFIFIDGKNSIATVSAKNLSFGYDEDLLSSQAISIARSKNILTNLYLILKSYTVGVYLSPSYKYSQNELSADLLPFSKSVNKKPVDALFKFENGRVTVFQPSEEGREVDFDSLNDEIASKGPGIFAFNPKTIEIEIPIKKLLPKVTTESVNNFGIKELVGAGNSRFAHSIPSRIHNITLAASKINGALIPPGKTFSFDATLGDVNAYTGYQQAYVIKDGKTILGDGGGVCQVSTTLFRAILNAGLPILERNQHSYRVGYYEQDSLPGLDATIYVPSVDLKFKNDTTNYILIQATPDLDNLSLNFSLYGAKDGRTTSVSSPVITDQIPAPAPVYQDDPNLPKGETKQVDFEAAGAKVTFTRTVVKDGKTIIFDKFVSNYQPWQAVYLRGTQ